MGVVGPGADSCIGMVRTGEVRRVALARVEADGAGGRWREGLHRGVSVWCSSECCTEVDRSGRVRCTGMAMCDSACCSGKERSGPVSCIGGFRDGAACCKGMGWEGRTGVVAWVRAGQVRCVAWVWQGQFGYVALGRAPQADAQGASGLGSFNLGLALVGLVFSDHPAHVRQTFELGDLELAVALRATCSQAIVLCVREHVHNLSITQHSSRP